MNKFLSVLVLVLWSAPSFAITKDSKVLLRYISTTWCGSCKELHTSFVENGFFSKSGKSDETLMIGKMPLKVRDGDRLVEVTAKIEFFEADKYQGTTKFEGEPDLDINVPYYPRMLVFVDGKQVYAGFDGYYPSEEQTEAASRELLDSRADLKDNRGLGLQFKLEQTLTKLPIKKK